MNCSKNYKKIPCLPPFPWLVVAGLGLAVTLPVRGSSLWTAPGSVERCMYADRKACRVGDIITVVVSESAAQSSTEKKKTSTDSSTSASISQFLYPTSVSKFGTKGGELPGTKFGGTSSFAGGGEVTNSQSVSARAAVLVTDVLPNGNMVIEGVRRVSFSGETQHIVLHGMVRPDDVASDNTVQSSAIANARLELVTQGDLADARKKGWIDRLYNAIRPF